MMGSLDKYFDPTMFATIINDCRDDNARGRQESRVASMLQCPVTFIGVASDIEASMQLVDVLDASEGRPGLVLVNVAPRGGHTKKWENGTPFGYFKYHDTLIVASVDGFVLSAVKKLGLLQTFSLLDTHTAAKAMFDTQFISQVAADSIPTTQFRSFDFTPRAGIFLAQGHTLPCTPYDVSLIPDLPIAVWHIDNFGNCKTTLTEQNIASNAITSTRYGAFPFVSQLRNLPDGEAGIVRGSSGIGDNRFLELMAQRRHFANLYSVQVGDALFSSDNFFRSATT